MGPGDHRTQKQIDSLIIALVARILLKPLPRILSGQSCKTMNLIFKVPLRSYAAAVPAS